MPNHPVVSREEWITARTSLLTAEKALSHQREEVARQRRALPRVRIEQDYRFTGPEGSLTLADLFGERSQLVIYHFMFGPDWDQGCPSCSLIADGFDGAVPHLAQRDVTLCVVSRGPIEKLLAFRDRMGWRFDWVSSLGSDFNRDFHVTFSDAERESETAYYNYKLGTFPSSEAPGLSVFLKAADGTVYHTYSCYSRGLDPLICTYQFLDLVPKGRDEDGLAYRMAWVRHHDRYDEVE